MIAATEKLFIHQTLKTNAAFAVHLKRFDYTPHDLLIFDQVQMGKNEQKHVQMGSKTNEQKNIRMGSTNNEPKHIQMLNEQNTETWHAELTERIQEHQDLVGIAFVLQYYLFLASDDGVLFARPRSNPKSMYHIADFKESIFFLIATFNVIALKFSNRISVFQVSEISTDLFLKLSLIRSVNCSLSQQQQHAPFLFGPFILFKKLQMDEDDDNDVKVEVGKNEREEQRREEKKKMKEDRESHLPEHLQEKNIPEHIKTGKNWKSNHKAMLQRFGFEIKERKKDEKKKKPFEVKKKGSVWLLLNYETNESQKVSFPNITDGEEEWRFSHFKSACMSYFVATFYSKKRFTDRFVFF